MLTSRASSRSSLRPNGFASVRPMVLGLAKLLALPLASAAPLGLLETTLHAFHEEEHEPDSGTLVVYLIVAVVLVLLGGVFAGLTIAFMGQDETYLQVIASSGDEVEKKHAAKVLNLLKKGKHWVLVTLLLSNVITNETLPIVLDRSLGGGWPAVVSSTVLIVIFGEVAPQSICVRYGLSIGAFMAPAVLGLMWLMFPVAWPTAKLLDYLLGQDHGTTYKKAGLKSLVTLHQTIGADGTDRLLEDEVNIINSVLDLKDKPVGDIITPMQDVFTMSADTVLDETMMDTILSQGYSRIPIHTPDNYRNFIGMLLVKILITYDPEDCKRVREFSLATLPETSPTTSCLDIINFFQEGKSHMVLVSDFPGSEKGALGVVTLEDVIEELIGEEIIDESDVFIDIHKAIRRMAPAPKSRFQHRNDPVVSDSEHDGKDQGENEPLLAPNKGDGSRKPSLRTTPTTFLMRRKSSNASDTVLDTSKPVPVRGNTTDMREHLKHLGPSNMASKPRATKYTSVKIKPGVGTIPENLPLINGHSPLARSQSVEPSMSRNQAGETASLLKSDVASDGVAAVAQSGYGTLSTTPTKSVDKMPAAEASKLARENTPTSPEPASQSQAAEGKLEAKPNGSGSSSGAGLLRPPEKLVIGDGESANENDTVSEMTALTRDRSKDRRVARSGSITQTMVDSGGLKKIVLETTSSSEDPDESSSTKTGPGAQLDGAADGVDEADAEGGGKKKRKKKRGSKKKGGADA